MIIRPAQWMHGLSISPSRIASHTPTSVN